MLTKGHNALYYLANVCLCNLIFPSSCLICWPQLLLIKLKFLKSQSLCSGWNIEFYLIPDIKTQIKKKVLCK